MEVEFSGGQMNNLSILKQLPIINNCFPLPIFDFMKFKEKKEVYFWLVFFALNFLLFIPSYLANIDRSNFFPIDSFWRTSPILVVKDLLYNRSNLDVFRWSIEFSVLLFMFCFFWRNKNKSVSQKSIFLAFIFPFYLLLLFYQVYHQAFYSLYQTLPFFYNDYVLLKVAWDIFWNDLNWTSIGLMLLLFLIVLLIYFALRFLVYFINGHSFSRISKGLMLLMILESGVVLFRWGYQAWPEHVLQFQVAPIVKNIQESKEAYLQMQMMDIPHLVQHKPYEDLALKQWPNFFFIFIESYGRILYDEESLKEDYVAYLPKLNAALKQNSWHSTSILSTAPVAGGASWISYSTFLDGFDFKNRGTYWALLQDSLFGEYQHLPRLLQSKGYRNYRLSAIGGSEDMEIPWETYTRFYAVDEWILNEQFDYKGLLYGWGPSPPDQFSLNFANQHIRKKATR